jgi:hypothetical protein
MGTTNQWYSLYIPSQMLNIKISMQNELTRILIINNLINEVKLWANENTYYLECNNPEKIAGFLVYHSFKECNKPEEELISIIGV